MLDLQVKTLKLVIKHIFTKTQKSTLLNLDCSLFEQKIQFIINNNMLGTGQKTL